MNHPRLIYYNDAHHFHAKRLEPPASIHMLEWPVNEIAGTGVDLLAIGLGYGDVYFHQSKVGRVVGQQKEVWANYIDWRIMRMVQEAAAKGTDQLREVIRRGQETGIKVFPSIKLQDGSVPYVNVAVSSSGSEARKSVSARKVGPSGPTIMRTQRCVIISSL